MAASDMTMAHFRQRHAATLAGRRVWVRCFPGDAEAEAMTRQAAQDAQVLLGELGGDMGDQLAVVQALQESAGYRAIGDWYLAEGIEHRGKQHGQRCAALAQVMHRRASDALKAAREAAAAVRERRAAEVVAEGAEAVFGVPSPLEAPPGVCSGAPSPPQGETK